MRVPYVLFHARIKFASSYKAFLDLHEGNTEIRTGCCDDRRTLVFKAINPDKVEVMLWLEDVEYEAFKKYLVDVGYHHHAPTSTAYLIWRHLPPGLPPRCLSPCLTCLAPIHGHFIAMWKIEADYDKWHAYFASPEHETMRQPFQVPVELYRCISDSSRILGFAADINWKAAVKYLGSRILYENIPAARRAGELEGVYYDGGQVEVEKDLLANVVDES